jgi:hypothetical protein
MVATDPHAATAVANTRPTIEVSEELKFQRIEFVLVETRSDDSIVGYLQSEPVPAGPGIGPAPEVIIGNRQLTVEFFDLNSNQLVGGAIESKSPDQPQSRGFIIKAPDKLANISRIVIGAK